MAVAAPTFAKLWPAQPFVAKSYTEFHENPTNGLVADTRLDGRTDGRGLYIRHSFYYFVMPNNELCSAMGVHSKSHFLDDRGIVVRYLEEAKYSCLLQNP